ncbi:hypothetical protein GKIL_4128 [Gloeobacter kilaueensis JS1]|uniref:Uncharacterized protein n=1 Tax=Gloeobacter kilaueensis (strain ATCC BAA-2537 / CCAP 1431/1 / ULC 316 / JS1) TaxID=1183438 RepID=U5QRY0_GLOK1|nr:hypothetical protein GKIL_4128 [Gloeobacter kilaueensis JS1]
MLDSSLECKNILRNFQAHFNYKNFVFFGIVDNNVRLPLGNYITFFHLKYHDIHLCYSLQSLSKYPGIFGTATLAGIDDEGAGTEGDAGEAAGQYPDVLAAIENVGPQIDVAAVEAVGFF